MKHGLGEGWCRKPQPGGVDHHDLGFAWWIQPEAGTYSERVTLSNSEKRAVTVNVPADSAGKTFHVICEVSDNGAPALTSHRRIIFAPTR